MKRNYILYMTLLGFNLLGSPVFSQNPNDFAKATEVLSPPPNAAALGKYGGINISLNTGMISKVIPIYDFSTTQLHVPISLVYSSAGFRSDEAPSRSGIGWVLNIGGVITRTVVGKQDEINPRLIPPAAIQNDAASQDFLSKVGESNYDAEPDVYNFNFNGYTGKFIYDVNSQPYFFRRVI